MAKVHVLPMQVSAISPDDSQIAQHGGLAEDMEPAHVAKDCTSMASVSFMDIFKNFVLMGWTAFGGPAAHVGLFQKVFVEQLKWMSAEVFTELFAVCQCMPGPSSTQMSFALGTTKQGITGGLLSGILFQYPGAIIMTICGLTAHHWASSEVINKNAWLAGLVGGLSAAGVALVASAAIGLWNKACGPADAKVIAGNCAVILLYFSAELIAPPDVDGRNWMWIFPALIVCGGCATFIWRVPLDKTGSEGEVKAEDSGVEHFGVGPVAGSALVALVFLVFLSSFILTGVLDYNEHKYLHWFSAFCRTGTVIWGGGQVVLPLLENEMVPTGWVERPVFFAGLALAQAMPGPLFNFAAFLGAAAGQKAFGDVGSGIAAAAVCWLGLFGPGVTLIFGMLPHWGRFRSNTTYKRALPGLNAAAVGLLIASLVQMATSVREVNTKPAGAIPREASTCIGLVAFWGVHWLKLPSAIFSRIQAPVVIVACGILGILAGVWNMK